ncbi:major facilitator superfamily domain-containing protein [Fennellomyces sp. T-0311]|nr:major facilitator superfamily domain-containing protein [Fennellomyces sp. T-0311]
MAADENAALRGRPKPILVKYRSSNIYVLLTASFSMFTGMVIYSIIIPLTPFMLDAMHQRTSADKLSGESANYSNQGSEFASREAGILFALYSIACGIGSPLFGYIGDKMTRRKIPMLLGILTLFGSTFIFLFATQFWMLVLARLLQGLSDACVWTLSLVLVSDTFPESVIGTQTSRVLMFHLIGSSSGAPIGGTLYHTMGYKAPFIFCIILAGVDFILRLVLIERRNNPKQWFEAPSTGSATEEPRITTTPIANPKNNLGIEEIISISSHNGDDRSAQTDAQPLRTDCMMRVLLHPRVISAILISFVHGYYTGVIETILPMHLANEFRYNSAEIGVIYLAQVLPSFIATPFSGYLYDKYGSKHLCSSMLLIAGVAMALMGIPSSNTPGRAIPLIVLTAIFGLSSSMVFPPVYPEVSCAMKTLAGKDDDTSGRSYSIVNVAYCIGNLIGPLFAGYLLNVIGFFWICITVASMILIIVPPVLLYSGEKIITLSYISKKFG